MDLYFVEMTKEIKNILKKINDLKLEKNIKILGHINDEELISIYKYCDAVIIPTYLGRSSLPLLESLYFNKKIYYSKVFLIINCFLMLRNLT